MNAQHLLIGYLLPITAAVAALWVAYRLLFVNSNRFQFNRLFLIGALLFSVALPFLGFEVGNSVPEIVVFRKSVLPSFSLNEIVIRPEGVSSPTVAATAESNTIASGYSLWSLLAVVYLIGVVVMTLLFFVKLGRIIALILRSPKHKMEGYTAVYTHQDQGSFSFFRYAFFPDEQVSPDIVRHELSHIAHGHSWDIVFAELMAILQWFNPLVYLYKKELRSLHEYTADHDVVATGIDKKNYMMLILQQCTAVDFSSMSNNFSLLLTKKRIKMITRHEKAKGFWWRLLATIPVLAVLMLVNVNCQPKGNSGETETSDLLVAGQWTGSAEGTLSSPEGTNNYLFETSLLFLTPEKGVLIEKLVANGETLFEDVAMDFSYTFDGKTKGTITPLNHDGTVMNDNLPPDDFEILPDGTMRYYLDLSKDCGIDHVDLQVEGFATFAMPTDPNVFHIDVMPEFPGGVEKMMEFIVTHIDYTEEAYNKGIQGDVAVSFNINENGFVTDPKIVHGIGNPCDDEVLRAIHAMPQWTPGMTNGKAIQVNYTMPVMFRIDYTDEGEVFSVKVRMEDEEGHSFHIAKSVNLTDAQVQSTMRQDSVYQMVEVMPEFPGGMDMMVKYLSENITYNEEAKKQNLSGRVFVSFVVEKDGSIDDVTLVRGIGELCDNEALRVVKAMPKWTPGKQNGEPVRVQYMLPIVFKLQ